MTSQYEKIIKNAAKYIYEDPESFCLAIKLMKEAKKLHDLEKEKVKKQDAQFSQYRQQSESVDMERHDITRLVETAIRETYDRDTGHFVMEQIYNYIAEHPSLWTTDIGEIDKAFDMIMNCDTRPGPALCHKLSVFCPSKDRRTQYGVPYLDDSCRQLFKVIDEILHA